MIPHLKPVLASEPKFPGKGVCIVQLVDDFQKAVVQSLQIFNTGTTIFFLQADLVPSDQALGAVAFLFPCPEERAPPGVQLFQHRFGYQVRGHEVDWKAPKNSINQN